jgi:hypothetical protein
MGRIGQAIEQTQRAYPGLLESNQNLMFMLKCRQFVEMVNGTDYEVKSIFFLLVFVLKLIFHSIHLGIQFSDIALGANVRHSIDQTLPTIADGSNRSRLQRQSKLFDLCRRYSRAKQLDQ